MSSNQNTHSSNFVPSASATTDDLSQLSEICHLHILIVERYISIENPFTFLGYSFGSIITLEVVNILESKGYHGNVILIDGSPAVLKQMLVEMNLETLQILETYLLCHLLSFYLPPEVISQHQENLLKCESWDARANMATNLVGERSTYGPASQKLVANGIYGRIRALETYTPSYSKLKSKIKLYKPRDSNIRGFEVDYGLSQISEQQVDIEVFDGNHVTILDNLEVAKALNSLIGFENSTSTNDS
ncbi:hypothetical protein JTB14_035063 [Gonioctena quinquepunctata]|nr:hypothetical protein JTB14_035063 [Gonioctena quinquepunctata]